MELGIYLPEIWDLKSPDTYTILHNNFFVMEKYKCISDNNGALKFALSQKRMMFFIPISQYEQSILWGPHMRLTQQ